MYVFILFELNILSMRDCLFFLNTSYTDGEQPQFTLCNRKEKFLFFSYPIIKPFKKSYYLLTKYLSTFIFFSPFFMYVRISILR